MTSKLLRLLPLLVLFLLALAAQPAAATEGSGTACCNLIDACESKTDEGLLAATQLGTSLGMCYWHDDGPACPDCACPYYLKLANLPSPSGFDGGTGCLQSREELIAALRQACADGRCCCPQRQPEGECPSSGRVWARDPRTGSCCEYANPCLAPAGWPIFPDRSACVGPTDL
jgi:hypothetical protein